MADVNRGNRPLSPFMLGPYYRPQMTSMSSIMVRITGIASFGVVFLIVCWLLASWAIWYHVLGRLRHVIWDFGYCLDVETSETLGKGMFIGATVLMLITAIVV